jgi:hypothetical protein
MLISENARRRISTKLGNLIVQLFVVFGAEGKGVNDNMEVDSFMAVQRAMVSMITWALATL